MISTNETCEILKKALDECGFKSITSRDDKLFIGYDEDGIFWVRDCCFNGKEEKDEELESIQAMLDELDKKYAAVMKATVTAFKEKFNKSDEKCVLRVLCKAGEFLQKYDLVSIHEDGKAYKAVKEVNDETENHG